MTTIASRTITPRRQRVIWLLGLAALVAVAVLAVGAVTGSNPDSSTVRAEIREPSALRIEDDPLYLRYGNRQHEPARPELNVEDDPLYVRYGNRQDEPAGAESNVKDDPLYLRYGNRQH